MFIARTKVSLYPHSPPFVGDTFTTSKSAPTVYPRTLGFLYREEDHPLILSRVSFAILVWRDEGMVDKLLHSSGAPDVVERLVEFPSVLHLFVFVFFCIGPGKGWQGHGTLAGMVCLVVGCLNERVFQVSHGSISHRSQTAVTTTDASDGRVWRKQQELRVLRVRRRTQNASRLPPFRATLNLQACSLLFFVSVVLWPSSPAASPLSCQFATTALIACPPVCSRPNLAEMSDTQSKESDFFGLKERPQSTIAASFSAQLNDIFLIDDGLEKLAMTVEQKKQSVSYQSSELAQLEERIRKAEALLDEKKKRLSPNAGTSPPPASGARSPRRSRSPNPHGEGDGSVSPSAPSRAAPPPPPKGSAPLNPSPIPAPPPATNKPENYVVVEQTPSLMNVVAAAAEGGNNHIQRGSNRSPLQDEAYTGRPPPPVPTGSR